MQGSPDGRAGVCLVDGGCPAPSCRQRAHDVWFWFMVSGAWRLFSHPLP